MPQAEDPRHNLRLSPGLQKKLKHSAVDNGRSMNAEILSRLEKSFEPSPMQEVESLLKSMVRLSDADRVQAAELLSRAISIIGKK